MSPDPARNRFIAIQAVRWAGVAMVLAGLLVLQEVWLLPRIAGYVLLFAGLVDALFVPTILSRRWRTPPPS
jgi:hypothetical protein